MKKKSFDFGRKCFGSNINTEIGPWFWFPMLKPGFSGTLHINAHWEKIKTVQNIRISHF